MPHNRSMADPGRSVAKRHHTVPQFYLRGFADDDQLTTVQLPGDRRFTQSVGDASVAKNFYSLPGHEDGDDALERALSAVEGDTAAIFKKITGGAWPLARDDRMALGYFIALQATRVPVQRRTMDHVARQMLRLQIGVGGKRGVRKELEKLGHPVTDALVERIWEQSTRPEGPPIERPREAHLEQMLETATQILPYIVGRPWTLIEFRSRALITSDSPVGLVPRPEEEDTFGGVGYMTAWGITFPLTRRLGLVMSDPEPLIDDGQPVERTHEGAFDLKATGSTAYERLLNHSTIVNASEWLFHHPDDARFVPATLPDPTRVMIEMSSEARDFDVEPWFESQDATVGDSGAHE